MTPEELRAALHPTRLPPDFLTLSATDLCAALGAGLLLAALIRMALRPAAQRRPAAAITAELAALEALPPPERFARRAALFRRLGGRLPADLQVQLYRPIPAEAAARADERLGRLLAEARRRGS